MVLFDNFPRIILISVVCSVRISQINKFTYFKIVIFFRIWNQITKPFDISEIEEMYMESNSAVSSCKGKEKIIECVRDKVEIEIEDPDGRKQK